MNRRKLVVDWISSQKNYLDEIISNTAEQYFNSKFPNQPNFIFDVAESAEELFQLGRGKDLCYDRPSIGFTYSLWYHSRRVNTFLNFFSNVFIENDEHIEIFDLGAGTGAVQWAIGLVYAGMAELNLAVPRLKIVNIDNSPFMLNYNRKLWEKFVEKYSQCLNINVDYRINSWNNVSDSAYSNPWICASYLFDHEENRELIAKDFVEIIRRYKPQNLLLLTSNQEAKRHHLESVKSSIESAGYEQDSNSGETRFFTGVLQSISELRARYKEAYRIRGFVGNATWDDQSFFGVVYKNKVSEQLVLESVVDTKEEIQSLNLYKASEPLRIRVELNEKQLEASRHTDRPTIIIGSAGSGKSIVITERIKNLVQDKNYDPNLRILLTSFNKELINQLCTWLQQILTPSIILNNNKGDFCFYFSNRKDIINIRVLHFDLLPTRIGGLPGRDQKNEEMVINEVIKNIRVEYSLSDREYEDVLNPGFLLDEFHRVFYGLSYRTEELYMTQQRVGRGNQANLGKGKKRKVVAACLNSYFNELAYHRNRTFSFTFNRLIFLDNLRKESRKKRFTHIFVDEFQDCTQADFEIFYQLVDDPNHLVIAGDLAQAVHLGRSYHIPRQTEMERRVIFRLEGSYRLPFRISECVRELSKRIKKFHNDGRGISPEEITPYKGSPPGARPIVVFADSVGAISRKIRDIFNIYREGYNLTKITIFEKDLELYNALVQLSIPTETDSILRMKGLEKDCVLWSVRTSFEKESEANELIYTILTRTSSLLIIALSGKISPVYQEIIGTFDRDRLIIWDDETRDRYSEFCTIPEDSSIEVVDE